MISKMIATYYSNARELVKKNMPKEARLYVLKILNYALDFYHKSSTIISKVKTRAFLEKWILVSKDLYDKGVTDYVLECFELDNFKVIDKSKTEELKEKKDNIKKNLDIDGLITNENASQGWCADIFEKNIKSVVKISANSGATISSGTGFIISKNGYLLTNDHIVFNPSNNNYHNRLYMSFENDNKKYKIDLLYSDKQNDIALCRFNTDDIKNFSVVNRISNYNIVKQGADCLIIGNPFDFGLAPFSGIIKYTKNSSGNLVYTAPSNPGDSGGAVFLKSGECIGINKSRTFKVNNQDVDGMANATPMDTINKYLNKWAKAGGFEI